MAKKLDNKVKIRKEVLVRHPSMRGMRAFSDLNKSQKANVRGRMRAPYVGYFYKVRGGIVAYRIKMGRV